MNNLLGQAVLFSEMTPAPAWTDRFHHWYDREHIPNRRGLPGFRSAQRYGNTAGAGFLAVYEMDTPQALASSQYRVVKEQPGDTTRWMLDNVTCFTRYTGVQIACHGAERTEALDAPVLYAVWFDVPEDRTEDFDAWYDQDHVPLLMRNDHWRMVRRFNVLSGEPGRFNRLALHYLADAAALDSDERQQARNTPWRARLASEPWFKGSYDVFTRHGERQALHD